ncbi:MAG: type I secretion system permease/ATPase [Myxococcota bacterium]|nr:type I secretion system permease/ATPase [Myxococcota bacterium]
MTRAMVVPAAFSLVLNVLALTVPLYMMQVFDRVLSSGSTETLLFLTLITCAALAVLGCIDWLRARIMVRVGVWIDRTLGPETFARALEAKLQGQPYRMEALSDLSQIRNFLGGTTLLSLFDAPWAPVYLLVIFLLHPWLGFLATFGAVCLFGLALLNERSTRGRLRDAGSRHMKNMQEAESAMRNAEVIDAMGMLAPVLRRWHAESDRVVRDQQLASDRAGLIVAWSKFFRLSLQMGVLGLGAYLVLQQRLTPGGMIAGSIIMSRALQPAEQAIATWRHLVGARQALGRLEALFARGWMRRQSIALPAPRGRLDVERLAYLFPGAEEPTLKGVSFSLEPGELLAIVGPSASGKTTLARSCVGVLRPSSGVVRLDGADVFSWRREDFGQYVGYLPQDVELFAGTVQENIARFADQPAEAVVAAAQLAGCHEMILRLPQGYDSEIGEGGSYLSGGQRQRIALARALFGQPRLVVLDEPNASLDADGEQILARTLGVLKKRGTTLIMVSHRLNLVQGMDRVLLLRDGNVAKLGSPAEVIKRAPGPAPVSAIPRAIPGGRRD